MINKCLIRKCKSTNVKTETCRRVKSDLIYKTYFLSYMAFPYFFSQSTKNLEKMVDIVNNPLLQKGVIFERMYLCIPLVVKSFLLNLCPVG